MSATSAGCAFSADDGLFAGAAGTVKADCIRSGFMALITQAQGDRTAPTPFTASGLCKASGFFLRGVAQPSRLHSAQGPGYGIYGLFNVSGSIAFGGGSATAEFHSGAVALYVTLDPAELLSTARDDMLLGNSSRVLAGSQARFSLQGQQAAGEDRFVIRYGALDLTAAGSAFFAGPRPFYRHLLLSSDNTTLDPVLTPAAPVVRAYGVASLLFCDS